MILVKRSLATRTITLVVSLMLLTSSSSAKKTTSAVPPGQLKKLGRGQAQKNCNSRKCAIDTSNIDLTSDEQIELVGLGPKRKTIQCRKKVFPGRGKAMSWYVGYFSFSDSLHLHDCVWR